MEQEILSIEKGWGADSSYYRVGSCGVTKIKENCKPIEYAEGGISKELVVYQVFTGELMICEIEANSGLTIGYDV